MNNLKKMLITVLPVLLISITMKSVERAPIFISLGRDCEAARNLQSFKLRQSAYPFDWINTYTFGAVCQLIENRFADFLNPAFLEKDQYIILNTKYHVHMRHDFPTRPGGSHYHAIVEPGQENQQFYSGLIIDNYLDYLDGVTEKYNRRIKRFFDLLDSDNTIVFVCTGAKPEEIPCFIDLMAKNHPLVKYTLLVIHNDPALNYDWKIPRVSSYFLESNHKFHPSWAHPDGWKALFTKLGYNKWVN